MFFLVELKPVNLYKPTVWSTGPEETTLKLWSISLRTYLSGQTSNLYHF